MTRRSQWHGLLIIALVALLTAAVTVAQPVPGAYAQGTDNVETGEGALPDPTPTVSSAPTPAATQPPATPRPAVATAPVAPSANAPSSQSSAADEQPLSEPSSKALRRRVKPAGSCVAALGPLEERVIVNRAGLRGRKGGTRTAVARRLGISRARVAQLERRALRNLRKHARAGDCAEKQPNSASQVASKPASTSIAEADPPVSDQTGAATTSARSYASEHPLVFVLAILVALVCGLLVLREVLRSFQGSPRSNA